MMDKYAFTRLTLPARQGGATLVIALLILVLIMMIGITAVTTSDTQYRLAGNIQFEDSALNNAEAAVLAGERWITNSIPDPVTNKKNFEDPAFTTADPARAYIFPFVATRPADRDTTLLALDWQDDAKSQKVGTNSAQRYVIELLSRGNQLPGDDVGQGGRASAGCNKVNTYLITGRGVSARGATKLVQSYFSVLACGA